MKTTVIYGEKEINGLLDHLSQVMRERDRLRGIAERAVSRLVLVSYGEETIDFEWPDILREVSSLRGELTPLGSSAQPITPEPQPDTP